MCSIVGGKVNKEELAYPNNLLNTVRLALTRKGYDGYSITGFKKPVDYEGFVLDSSEPTEPEVFNFKSYDVEDIICFLNEMMKKDLPELNDIIFIAFGRATPETEEQATNLEMIQPFTYGSTTTVHHGLITNYKDLVAKHNLRPNTNIDSEILPFFMSNLLQNEDLNNSKNAFKMFSQVVEGSYVSLFLHENENRRYLGYLNNYLGLWGVSYDEHFKINSSFNRNFLVYNTDLSEAVHNQFQLPLYNMGWLAKL